MKNKRGWLVGGLLFVGVLALTAPTVAEPSGTWTKKGYAIQGAWSIVDDDGKLFLELDEAFKTRNAPDLKLFLSKQAPGAINNGNATQAATLIAQLDKNKGAQRYALPVDDLGDFKALVLHCEKYSKLWGVAALP